MFLRETASSASSYYDDLISIFCWHVILLLFHCRYRSSFYRCSFLVIGLVEVVKVLGQRKHRSQDLRRRQKQNLPKARRKTWPTVISNPSKKSKYPLLLHFVFSCPYIFPCFFRFSRTLKFNKESVRNCHTITGFKFPRTSFRSQ